MEHKTKDLLRKSAEVYQENAVVPMTREQRIERWAQLLEREPDRRLATIGGTEYSPSAERGALRAYSTPISVAFDDPVFRAEGMRDDTYGEARRFFSLSDQDLHRVLCDCHHGASVKSSVAAGIVRQIIKRPAVSGLLNWLRKIISA
ncbi:MAG TPA: hypothetical protein VLQ68_10825 [Rhizobiaceae bacterium]|nr:hypothetical protein [Rhizobiaceae bacterium]